MFEQPLHPDMFEHPWHLRLFKQPWHQGCSSNNDIQGRSKSYGIKVVVATMTSRVVRTAMASRVVRTAMASTVVRTAMASTVGRTAMASTVVRAAMASTVVRTAGGIHGCSNSWWHPELFEQPWSSGVGQTAMTSWVVRTAMASRVVRTAMTSRGWSNSNDLPALLYTIAVLDPVDIAALLCERVPACKDHVTVCRLCFATYGRFIIVNWPYVLITKYFHIKSTTVYSMPLVGIGTPPQPPTRRLVCPLPPVSGGRGTLPGEKGVGRVPIPTRGIHCGTLNMYVLCGPNIKKLARVVFKSF